MRALNKSVIILIELRVEKMAIAKLPNKGTIIARSASLWASFLKIIVFFKTYFTAIYAPSQSAKILNAKPRKSKTAGTLIICAIPARTKTNMKKINPESNIVVSQRVVQIQN